MARKRRAEGRVKDIDGVWFEVAEYRGTAHGFDVVLGWVEGKKKGWYGGAGRSQVVLTAPLARYLTRFRMQPGKMALPIGHSAIGKLRDRLGFHLRKDIRHWWEDRRKDLAELSGSEFAAKHGMTPGAAHYTRQILFGPNHRPKFWWTAPKVLAILTSNRSDAEMAQALAVAC